MAAANEDIMCSTLAKHVHEQTHILFEALIPNYEAKEVFPKNLQERFKVLFQGLFNSSRVPDVVKYQIQSLLKRYLPEYPEMRFLWNGMSYERTTIFEILKFIQPPRDINDVVAFFEGVSGFKKDVGDFIQEYVDIFLTNRFDESFTKLLLKMENMMVQSGVQIKSLTDYYSALTGCIAFAPEIMSRFKKSKYRSYLTFYFCLCLLQQAINKIVIELIEVQKNQ